MYQLDEQEIVITKIRTDDYVEVYVNDATWLTKLLKFAEPIDPEYKDGRIISCKFKLEPNQLSIRKPSKRVVSEEQRKAMSERMKKMHNKQD